MTGKFAANPYYVACEEQLKKLHGLIAEGKGDTEEADALREELDVSVLLFDYRGYGRSEGAPDEAGILMDARAARSWLARRSG